MAGREDLNESGGGHRALHSAAARKRRGPLARRGGAHPSVCKGTRRCRRRRAACDAERCRGFAEAPAHRGLTPPSLAPARDLLAHDAAHERDSCRLRQAWEASAGRIPSRSGEISPRCAQLVCALYTVRVGLHFASTCTVVYVRYRIHEYVCLQLQYVLYVCSTATGYCSRMRLIYKFVIYARPRRARTALGPCHAHASYAVMVQSLISSQ